MPDSKRFPPLQVASLLVIVLVLGFLFAVQVRSQATAQRYLSGQDNVSLGLLITGLSESNQQLSDARAQVRGQLQQLSAAAASGSNPAATLQRELDSLEVLDGTAPVHGPGLVMTIQFDLHDYEVQDLANALRQSGAEAVEISGHRLTARSVIGEKSGKASVDGRVMAAPYKITAIGDPTRLATGADTIAASLKARGGVTVSPQADVRITATVPERPVIYSAFGG
ncbi:MAG: DUF881 domain-containing protein [Candidatus Dormibacteria bacterium]